MSQLVTVQASLPVDVQGLAALAEVAQRALSPHTLRAYQIDGKAFKKWCEAKGYQDIPASPETVKQFLESNPALSVATIRRRMATISRMHRFAGLPSPTTSELVKLTVQALAKARGTDQKQAAPLTQRHADTIKARMGNTLKDARDLALMLVGRDLLARASELVSLEVDAVEFQDQGALASLRRRKTSTETHTYYLGPEAAQALRDWLQRADIQSGPIFQSITKGGKVTGRALTARDVSRILKSMADRGGVSGAVSGHSLRVGMAVDLVGANTDLASVMQAGGWSTPRMVARYSEKVAASQGAVARFYARRG